MYGGGDDLLVAGALTNTSLRQIYFEGGLGNDTLDGTASTIALVADGGDGADSLVGGTGADTLRGAGGADVLVGGRGGDLLDGGSGDDRLSGRSATEAIGSLAGPITTRCKSSARRPTTALLCGLMAIRSSSNPRVFRPMRSTSARSKPSKSPEATATICSASEFYRRRR